MGSIDTRTREVATLDILKLAAVVFMLTDHVGLYLFETNWLRILGRPTAVIFGFLIGNARSRQVPPSWIALGLALTLIEEWLDTDEEGTSLDILITLALTRIVMPYFDRLHAIEPRLLALVAVVLALLAEPVGKYLEYGTEVPLAALLGAAVRLNDGSRRDVGARDAVALVAICGLSLLAIRHFEFTGWEVVAATATFALTICVLSRFRRETVAAPAALAPLLRFVGHNTLWIYAAHVVVLQLVSWWLEEWVYSDDLGGTGGTILAAFASSCSWCW